MTETTLRQFVEHVARRAEHMFKKQGGHLSPMYHAVDAAGTSYVMAGPPGSKDEAVAKVRAFLQACGAVRVAFLDEAWILDQQTTNADIDKIYREGNTIRNHPGRTEAVIVSAEDATEGVIMATMEIIRHGNRAVLGKLKITPAEGHMEGRMVGLLPQLGTKH